MKQGFTFMIKFQVYSNSESIFNTWQGIAVFRQNYGGEIL